MTFYVCLRQGIPIFETVSTERKDCIGKYLKLKAWEFRESPRVYGLMLDQAQSNFESGEITTAKMEIKLSEECYYEKEEKEKKDAD